MISSVHRDVMVRMRDGDSPRNRRLSSCRRRAGLVETPLPVIMERTPYGKTRALALRNRAGHDRSR